MTVYIVMRRMSGGEDAEVVDVVTRPESAETLAGCINGKPGVRTLRRDGVVEWEADRRIQWIDAREVRP